MVWVEGEPGIGKSSLVAEALAAAGQPSWDVGWAAADQLMMLPLRVMQDCLQVRPTSPDPRRAQAADLLRSLPSGPLSGGDATVNGAEVLLTLADELCAAAPTVLVVDDLQWADDASLSVWHQLASSISQLRLLLIGICRPTPRRKEVEQVRAGVIRRDGEVVTLGPLPEADVTALITAMAGATPWDGLRRLTAQANGNPLYVRELVDVLLREQAARMSADVSALPSWKQLPGSLAAVLTDRLSSVSGETVQLLRMAALLGGRFAVTDLAVVLRQPVSDLAASLQEAVAAGIVMDSGPELAFRHPLLRQAIYESMPEALRTALHAEAARELTASGADTLSVAQQLSGAGGLRQEWARDWLPDAAPRLATRAPQLAVDLLQWGLEETPVANPAWDVLIVSLVRALLAVGSFEEAVDRARVGLTVRTEIARQGERCWMLAHALVYAGHGQDIVVRSIHAVLAEASLPRIWQARLLAVLAMSERIPSGMASSRAFARRAMAVAEGIGDPFATAQTGYALWLANSIGRDHASALYCVDRSLLVMGNDPLHDDLRSAALDARTFSLQNLDEWPQAELALRQSREFAQRTARPDRATLFSAAVLGYWLGRWDDALAELGPDPAEAPAEAPALGYAFLRERWAALLLHGVAALIAGRREQRCTADRHLREGLALPIVGLTDRENQDFLVAAHALSLEQTGGIRQAMLRLAEILPRGDNEMTLTHQWLPDLVRLALAAGDRQLAHSAAKACQEEATAETRPARAAAASLRCDGLLGSDPELLREAVAHFRAVGPAAELPAALEDLAVVLAERGQQEDARMALREAVDLYEGMGARWDIRRAEGRVRPLGIRRGVRGRRPARPTSGWGSLTPTEVKVAALVARGDSTADIARNLFLSGRTVRTYISHIMTKLDARSRIDITREALRQGMAD